MQNLSNKDLTAKARQHDHIHNEGGEGFNPYSQELFRRSAEAEAARPKSLAEKKAAIMHKIEILDCSVARESGTFDQARVDDLWDNLKKIETEEASEFAAEWTVELTKTRRAGWNDFVRSLVGKNGKITDGRAIYQRQRDQGWGLDDLKRAIKLYNL